MTRTRKSFSFETTGESAARRTRRRFTFCSPEDWLQLPGFNPLSGYETALAFSTVAALVR